MCQNAPKEGRRRRAVKRSSPFLFCPLRFLLKHVKTLELIWQILLSMLSFWTTVSPHDAFSAPLAHPPCGLPSIPGVAPRIVVFAQVVSTECPRATSSLLIEFFRGRPRGDGNFTSLRCALDLCWGVLRVNSPALILSKYSGVFWRIIG